VLGASGYAGAVAAMLVHRHPFFELAHVTARSEAGARLDDLHPRTRVPMELEAWDADAQSDVDAALVCWPHGVAAPAVAALRERGVRVVDLSADFRLRDRGIYEDWYGKHGAPALFGRAVYGLPELHRDEIAGADLVANPGCYPTAALLAPDWSATSSSTPSPASRAPGASRPAALTSSPRTRTSRLTRSTATATRRRSSRSSPARARG
jgi:N-acetyl-gamma-glutamyl-phosphate reductase